MENKAMFAAYSRLTVVNHFKNLRAGNRSPRSGTAAMDFHEFMDAIEKRTVVSAERSRSLPASEVLQSAINARYTGDYRFERQVLGIVETAYTLGLVGPDGTLAPPRSRYA
ncbi:hypothetical protein [Geochorda subterranea]|uniref:Uncharacterized protein n=1 Tax=Geochorda subterranea TaxID=3109564 RepID=A0ABZ1BSY7_9FIRM|nr:hypothetical protein [Limnochorda sp. LNt]WRP15575.1 hypothetical protein VLY81_05280 [Limnochorda sp. LNt]